MTKASEVLCIHESFHRQAALTPQAPCLIDVNSQPSITYTYQQVQAAVIRLAVQLRELGAGRDKIVAVYQEPSVDYVVTLWAILTAGAAYVPLELAYPTTMLQRVLQDAQPVAVVTHRDQAAQLPLVTQQTAVICLDEHVDGIMATTTTTEEHAKLVQLYESWPKASLDDLAFLVYSSGSTGQPKGIANQHRAPALSYNWRFRECVDYQQGDRVACSVFFVWEVR